MNKRMIVSFLMASVLCAGNFVASSGFVSAQDLGLTAGLEIGFGDDVLTDVIPSFTPGIAYENSFGDLDLSAELDYTLVADDPLGQSLYFDLSLGYNISLGDSSTLTIGLENENDSFILAPDVPNDFKIGGVLIPSVGFAQSLDFGDLSFALGIPLSYADNEGGDFSAAVDITAGLALGFGLGIELTGHIAVVPTDGAGYDGLDLVLSYEQEETFAISVEIDTTNEFTPLTIIPEFDFFLNQFTIYAKAEFGNVGDGDINIAPAIGVKYSF